MRIVDRRMMCVKPEAKPRERKLKSGVWVPDAGANVETGLETERRENEWWPHSALVAACEPNGIVFGEEPDGNYAMNYQRGTMIPTTKPKARPHWRTPVPGDTCHFGYKALNPNGIDSNGMIWKEIVSAYCVTPADGSPMWAVGPWAVIEPLPEIHGSVLAVATSVKAALGIGVIRLAGDGFLESIPSARPGMVVSFMVHGSKNPVMPNPSGGKDLAPILAEWVIGIDEKGISDGELQEMKAMAARQAEEARQALKSAQLKVESEEKARERKLAEQEEALWRESRKEQDRTHIRYQSRHNHHNP